MPPRDGVPLIRRVLEHLVLQDIRERANEVIRRMGLLPVLPALPILPVLPALPILPAPPIQLLPLLPSSLNLSEEMEIMERMVHVDLCVSQETFRNVYGIGEPSPDPRYSVFREEFTPSFVQVAPNTVWQDVVRTREMFAQERLREEEDQRVFDAMDRISGEGLTAHEHVGDMVFNTRALENMRRRVEVPEFDPTETPSLMGRYLPGVPTQPPPPPATPRVHIFWPTAWEQLLIDDDFD